MSQIKKVGVLGCGLMGSGIAQACASAGFTTVARDVDDSSPGERSIRNPEIAGQTGGEGQAAGGRP